MERPSTARFAMETSVGKRRMKKNVICMKCGKGQLNTSVYLNGCLNRPNSWQTTLEKWVYTAQSLRKGHSRRHTRPRDLVTLLRGFRSEFFTTVCRRWTLGLQLSTLFKCFTPKIKNTDANMYSLHSQYLNRNWGHAVNWHCQAMEFVSCCHLFMADAV
jgi:hypothetical protein